MFSVQNMKVANNRWTGGGLLEKEKVKLDQVLKFLFSTSNKVLVKLLNGVFDENFEADEVELVISNNEFIEDDLGLLRGDMFFDILQKEDDKVSFHIEFQTKNDNTMVVRMFEYGFKKGKEQLKTQKGKSATNPKLIFPKQKVIFFEENKNVKDVLALEIEFPNGQEVLYTVDVMKYWEYSEEELIERSMYPLLPLQLFGLRKELERAQRKNDMSRIIELSKVAKQLAKKLCFETKELFDADEILGEDFHKMLKGFITNLAYIS